jgi:hypothetical protein
MPPLIADLPLRGHKALRPGRIAAAAVASSARRSVRVRKSEDTHSGGVRYQNCRNSLPQTSDLGGEVVLSVIAALVEQGHRSRLSAWRLAFRDAFGDGRGDGERGELGDQAVQRPGGLGWTDAPAGGAG